MNPEVGPQHELTAKPSRAREDGNGLTFSYKEVGDRTESGHNSGNRYAA